MPKRRATSKLLCGEGFRTFLDGFLSFRAFWTAMPPPLFLTSMPADKRRPLIVGALMVQARPRGKEAMFTRSTRGCGHSDALSLALAACLCPKLNGSARRPGLRQLGESGWRSGQEDVWLRDNDRYILGIYQVYTAIYTFWLNIALCVTSTSSLPWHTWADVHPLIWDLLGACFSLEIMYKSKDWLIQSVYQVYTYYIPSIYQRIIQHRIVSPNLNLLMILLWNLYLVILCNVLDHPSLNWR